MKIVLNGIHANLRFASAHIIPNHPSCGYIHGHSYFVDVEIIGNQSGKFNFVVDFKDVKGSARKICDKLDHRVLIPIFNHYIEFKDVDNDNLSLNSFKNKKYIEFKIKGKEYKLPKVDCVLLPLKHSSAEELSKLFTDKIANDLISKDYDIYSVSVGVNEGIGQGAFFKKVIED
ncbi:6-carboxytetrahydropterin synthase [Methanobrevibacter filiformis]|uniref:6-carboxy-5,6,7,8-tetrahydropterin synthase n=1 Tax=Methanobrevibacter filiformis TaxID=55758 RepID=A0A166APD3_9EURY|nr:6-carboxytetrahydropterin synthase [Methanobrevibacter filiformis]KZX12298.1 6-carboxy-5,6,7,8-tetrahydropterin synthase [Methanobrevibacter filiformis]